MTRVQLLGVAFAVSLLAAGCGDSNEPGERHAASLEIVGDSTFTTSVGTELPVRVRVLDQRDDPFVDAIVSFEALDGSFNLFNARSDGNGIVSINWALPVEPGVKLLRARLGTIDSVTFTATVSADVAVSIQRMSDDSVVADAGSAAESIRFRAVDQYGNPVPGTTITLVASHGSVVPATIATNQVGQAIVTWTLGGTPGYMDLTATIPGQPALHTTGIATWPLLPSRIVAGASHTCRITSTGTTQCWGTGTLGNGSTSAMSLPVTVAGGHQFTRLSAGSSTCGITATDAIYCWGSDQVSNSPTPSLAPLQGPLIDFDVGDGFACGILPSYQVRCWGAGTEGQLGNGLSTSSTVPVPVTISGSEKFVRISAGASHACAANGRGAVWCWGNVPDGPTPAPVRVSTPQLFVAISVAARQSCGLTFEGMAYCWGTWSASGYAPASEPFPINPTVRFQNILAGKEYACGVGTNQQGYCMGRRETRGARNARESLWNQPAVQSISAGTDHACALTADGTTLCWGVNLQGAVGVELVRQALEPRKVAGNNLFQSIAKGVETCGLTQAGVPFCWGGGETNAPTRPEAQRTFKALYGAVATLGMTQTDQPWSIPMLGDVAGPVAQGAWRSVYSGALVRCGVQLSGDGFCWGLNAEGGFGDSTLVNSNTPVRVAGGHSFREIVVGTEGTCGLVTDSTAYCWGRTYPGDGGGGRNYPVPVSGGRTFVSLTPSTNGYTCGVTAAGTGWCWGRNSDGQLGTGTLGDASTPVQVAVPAGLIDIAASHNSACGLLANGQVYCWGSNTWGTLGNGTSGGGPAPAPIAGGHRFAAIASGRLHVCGLKTSGEVWCWGDNREGHLGIGSSDWFPKPIVITE